MDVDHADRLLQVIDGLESGDRALLPLSLATEPGKLLDLLLQAREVARQQKNYALADRLRDELRDAGILIEDTPRGARWRLV